MLKILLKKLKDDVKRDDKGRMFNAGDKFYIVYYNNNFHLQVMDNNGEWFFVTSLETGIKELNHILNNEKMQKILKLLNKASFLLSYNDEYTEVISWIDDKPVNYIIKNDTLEYYIVRYPTKGVMLSSRFLISKAINDNKDIQCWVKYKNKKYIICVGTYRTNKEFYTLDELLIFLNNVSQKNIEKNLY